MKHKILITQRIVIAEQTGEVRECLDLRWAKLLSSLGYMPISLHYHSDPLPYFDLKDVCGVILTGGNDLSSVQPNEYHKLRDDFETIVLEQCISKRLPILGVCRGMQMIAHYFKSKINPIESHINLKHKIVIEKVCKLFNEYPNESEVNSTHKYGLTELNQPLVKAAAAADGSIEAFEHTTLPIAGIMWHPERETPPSEYDIKLLKKLFI